LNQGELLHGSGLMPAARSCSAASLAKTAVVKAVPACAFEQMERATRWAWATLFVKEWSVLNVSTVEHPVAKKATIAMETNGCSRLDTPQRVIER
jgi:hypothetical protein